MSLHIDQTELKRIAQGLDARALRCNDKWLTRCPSHANRHGKNLSIAVGQNGALLVHCYAGCAWQAVMGDLKAMGFIQHEGRRFSKQEYVPNISATRDNGPVPEKGSTPQKSVNRIWEETQDAENTLVEKYLRSRCLTITPPPTIRFHPRLQYWEQNSADTWVCTGQYPAMVSKIQTYPSTDLQTIHVTYLNQHGSGKADVACPKKIKSRTMGGAVQFNGDSLECLAIGEGIETCLSYYQENYRISVWSALSSSNFKSIILPPPSITKEVIILSDNDHQGLEAAQFLALRLVQEKRVIRIVAPQQDKSDFNDLLTNFNNPSIRTV